MINECACLCGHAGHHEVCGTVPEPGLRLSSGLTVVKGQPVCRPCYETVREAAIQGTLPAQVDGRTR